MCPGRILLGGGLLFLVDVIWIVSAEITRHIFKEIDYNKPFFSTYFKSSLLVIYLFGFVFYRPWGRRCIRCTCAEDSYSILENSDTESESEFSSGPDNLSPSQYVLIDLPSNDSSDDSSDEGEASHVRFNKTAEIRSLPDSTSESIARMSHQNAQRARQGRRIIRSTQKVTLIAKQAFVFSLPFFVGQYSYQMALSLTSAPVVNILSSTSGLFTLILSAVFPSQTSDRFSLMKFLFVIVSIGGTVLISVAKIREQRDDNPQVGAAWALVSSACYASYLVLLRRSAGPDLDVPMFFGFVGLFVMLMLWPGLVVLHLSGIEEFVLPDRRQFLYLGLNGLVGTVLCELIWLWACFLTSPLQATLALSFINPGSILINYLLSGVRFGFRFLIGAGLNLFGYVGISIMNSGFRKSRRPGVLIELDER